MDLDASMPDVWQEADLPALLRHQLSAPLGFDLRTFPGSEAEERTRDESLAEAASASIKTFEDLFFRGDPPLRLLRLSKDFFKNRIQESPKDSRERRLAYLFYLVSILAAGERADQDSRLSSGELRKALQWALTQKWVDEQTRALLLRAKADL